MTEVGTVVVVGVMTGKIMEAIVVAVVAVVEDGVEDVAVGREETTGIDEITVTITGAVQETKMIVMIAEVVEGEAEVMITGLIIGADNRLMVALPLDLADLLHLLTEVLPRPHPTMHHLSLFL